jgi:hypothetical protein
MRILPLQTTPPTTAIQRRHRPRHVETYQRYKPCLRWDFGFTCGFCLLHESDFSGGTNTRRRAGIMTVEHVQPRSAAPELASDYGNLALACRFCNRSRSNTSTAEVQGKQLLVPTVSPWALHFRLDGDRLEAQDGDDDACHTRDTYDLNDDLKVELRKRRRERLEEWQEDVRELPPLIDQLYRTAFGLSDSAQREVLDAIEVFEEQVSRARRYLHDYTAIPLDCDATCGCGSAEHHSLPLWLEDQTWLIPV